MRIEIGRKQIIDLSTCERCGTKIKIAVIPYQRHWYEKEGWCECPYPRDEYYENLDKEYLYLKEKVMKKKAKK